MRRQTDESVDLSAMASKSFGPARTMTIKICELCGKTFFPLVISVVRDCEECRERTARRKKEMAQIPHETPEDSMRFPSAREIAEHVLGGRAS